MKHQDAMILLLALFGMSSKVRLDAHFKVLLIANISLAGVTLKQSVTMDGNQVEITGNTSLQWTCGLGATAHRCDASALVEAGLAV